MSHASQVDAQVLEQAELGGHVTEVVHLDEVEHRLAQALGDLVDTAPDARILTVMAAISRGEGASDVVVKGWLARALTAPRGPQWVCDKCHAIHDGWQPVCDNCGSFDTLSWKTPPATSTFPLGNNVAV